MNMDIMISSTFTISSNKLGLFLQPHLPALSQVAIPTSKL